MKFTGYLPLLSMVAGLFMAGCGSAEGTDPADLDESDDVLTEDGKADAASLTAKMLGAWSRINNPTGGNYAGFRFSVVKKKRVFFGETIAECATPPSCARTRIEGKWSISTRTLTLTVGTTKTALKYTVSGDVLTLTTTTKKVSNLQRAASFCAWAPDCTGQIPFSPTAPPSVPLCNESDLTCQTVARTERTATCTLRFSNQPATAVQHGALVAGNLIGIEYDLSRLTKCRETHNGNPTWDIRVSVRFMPEGQVIEGSVNGMLIPENRMSQDGPSAYMEVEIPAGTQQIQVWAYNQSASSSGTCTDWDSLGGSNYLFPVQAAPASAVSWAGDWGQGFSHQCAHQDGIAEPIDLTGTMTAGTCMLIDADVYVPGITDGVAAHPELIAALAEYSVDGLASQITWLTYQGRVGNNYRYRWELPFSLRMTRWQDYKYTFKFATGDEWFRIGQDPGPTGGQPRTIHRAY